MFAKVFMTMHFGFPKIGTKSYTMLFNFCYVEVKNLETKKGSRNGSIQ